MKTNVSRSGEKEDCINSGQNMNDSQIMRQNTCIFLSDEYNDR